MAIKAEAKPDPASKAEASQPTTVATQREKPTPDAHIHYAAPLSASDWLGALKQAVGNKTAQGGGGESFPKALAGQLNATDKQLYFIGCVGKSALGPGVQASAQTVPPKKAGALLYALEQLWKKTKFHDAHSKKYKNIQYLVKKWGRGDFSLWWCFSSVVVFCEAAKTRKHPVIPALTGVVCLFAVVLAGDAF